VVSSGSPAKTVGTGVAAHAVAGVDDDLQRPQVRQARDQRLEVVAVAGQQVLLRDAPGGPVGRRQPGVEEALGVGADLAQPALLAHRRGAGQAELDPVVLRRVVAGGEHRTGDVQRAGGVVEQVGRAEAGVDDVGALARRALREGLHEGDAGLAHVPGDDDAVGAGEADEGGAEGAGDVGVELVGDHAPDVVGLDDRRQVAGHAATLVRGGCAALRDGGAGGPGTAGAPETELVGPARATQRALAGC
jgi:hypothetical protein